MGRHSFWTCGRSVVNLSAALDQDPDSGLPHHAGAGFRPVSVRSPCKRLLADSCGLREQACAICASLPPPSTRFVAARKDVDPLRDFGGELRQTTILRVELRRPLLLIANDFESGHSRILRRCARRWLVEQSIAEQHAFFHLDRLSSSMVVKACSDLALIVPACNLLRLLGLHLLAGYRQLIARLLFDRLPCNVAETTLEPDLRTISLTKKRDLPDPLEALQAGGTQRFLWRGAA